MARPRTDTPSVSTFADHEVIVPPNKLANAVHVTGRDLSPDLDAIARAEDALTTLSNEFAAWMQAECDQLEAARQQVWREGCLASPRDDLFRAAHDIKGQAATFGYPLAGEVADSLCRLIEHCPDPERIPLTLIDQHVDGVRAIIREDVRETGHKVGAALAVKLREVTDEFLTHENRHRPEYLESIMAPSLAPGA